MKGKKNLTSKQEQFCIEYLIDMNATKSAIRAGYSLRSARQIGQKNMSKHDIQEKIDTLLRSKNNKKHLTIERIISEISIIAFTNVADFFYVDENDKLKVNNLKLIGSSNPLPFEVTKYGIKVSNRDKLKALEILLKYLSINSRDEKIRKNIDLQDLTNISTDKLRRLEDIWNEV